MVRHITIAIVVQHGQFIPHIDQGNPAKSRDQRVAHQNALHSQILGPRLPLALRLFQTRERGKAARNPLVPRGRIGLKQRPSGKGAGKDALIEIR